GLPASVINPGVGPSKTAFVNPFNGNKCRYGDPTTLAEVGSLQLEMQYLSHATGDPRFAQQADKAMQKIIEIAGAEQLGRKSRNARKATAQTSVNRLFATDVHPRESRFTSDRVSMGSGGDSFYEYLLKQYLLRPYTMRDMRQTFADTIRETLEKVRGNAQGTVFLGQATFSSSEPIKKMEHLACFAPGMLALAYESDPENHRQSLVDAEAIMESCMAMYATATGLAAESYDIVVGKTGPAKLVPSNTMKFSLLRPETMESAFVLWRVTGNRKYTDFGWRVFTAIEKHSRLPGKGSGYTAVADVNFRGGNPEMNRLDRLDSFFFAETLKYLYLLFCPPCVLPLSDYVFTTEAHPLPVLERPPFSQ
ncbi:glycoside hydrolase, partial [Baffinella frigidus]